MPIPPTRDWAIGETLRAANLITYVNNVLNSLAGRRGTIQAEDSFEVLSGPDGNRFIKLPAGATAQRPALPAAGMVRYNTTESEVEVYDGTAWKSIGAADYDDTITHGQNMTWSTGSNNTRTVLGHSLGRPPIGFQMYIVNKVAGGQYSVGNEVMIPSSFNEEDSRGVERWYAFTLSSLEDTTCVLNFRQESHNGFSIQQRNNGDTYFADPTNWNLRIKLW